MYVTVQLTLNMNRIEYYAYLTTFTYIYIQHAYHYAILPYYHILIYMLVVYKHGYSSCVLGL